MHEHNEYSCNYLLFADSGRQFSLLVDFVGHQNDSRRRQASRAAWHGVKYTWNVSCGRATLDVTDVLIWGTD